MKGKTGDFSARAHTHTHTHTHRHAHIHSRSLNTKNQGIHKLVGRGEGEETHTDYGSDALIVIYRP